MKTLAVVPARGASKGIVRKNLRPLGGKPLIAHTIECGLRARLITRLVVSTDDSEIAQVSRNYGADVPFDRPAELASDVAPQIDVAIHALNAVEEMEGVRYDSVVLLQPTNPLRISDDIDGALAELESSGTDSVISFYRVEQGHPYYMYTFKDDRVVPLLPDTKASRRQEFPAVYVRNGAIYGTRRDVLVQQRSFYGKSTKAWVMPYERSINIDTEIDLALAEFFLSRMKATV